MDLTPCRVYLHDPAANAGHKWPARYEPAEWRFNKYAQELWLKEALLAGHPWRVNSAKQADLIVVAANFSMLCTAHKMYAARHMWHLLLNDTLLCNGTAIGRTLFDTNGDARCQAVTAPKLVSLSSGECTLPWRGWSSSSGPPSRPPPGYIFLVDHKSKVLAQNHVIVSPAVVARPAWLTGMPGSSAPARVPWSSRQLLFFAGHIPKLYVNALRFKIWEQLHNEPAVTRVSSTLPCTVGAYEVCSSPERVAREHRTFCESNGWKCRVRDSGPPCATKTARQLHGQCKAYRKVNWTSVLPAIRQDSSMLPREEYLRVAHQHRFCLAAPGDFVSTPKISEFVAVGASGGCIPVIVVPDVVGHTASGMLPFADALNYCAIGFLVRVSAAKTSMRAILDRLSRVSEGEAVSKHAALRRARDAFVWREHASGTSGSAVDHILSAACTMARGMRDGAPLTVASQISNRTGTYSGGAAGLLEVGGDCLLA